MWVWLTILKIQYWEDLAERTSSTNRPVSHARPNVCTSSSQANCFSSKNLHLHLKSLDCRIQNNFQKRKIFGSVKNTIIMAQRSSMHLRVTSIVHPCYRMGSLTKTRPHTRTRVLIGWLHFSNSVANISWTLKRLNLQVQSTSQTLSSPYREELEETVKKRRGGWGRDRTLKYQHNTVWTHFYLFRWQCAKKRQIQLCFYHNDNNNILIIIIIIIPFISYYNYLPHARMKNKNNMRNFCIEIISTD